MIEKFKSVKFLCWLITMSLATPLLCLGYLSGTEWLIAALISQGTHAAGNVMTKHIRAKQYGAQNENS